MGMFEQIHVSDYLGNGAAIKEYYRNAKWLDVFRPHFDSRLDDVSGNEPSNARCVRPQVELIFDNYGEAHLCCQDWRGEIKIGNMWNDDFDKMLSIRKALMDNVCGRYMKAAPERCLRCKNRFTVLPTFNKE
jgi:hypothetical protein